MKFTKKLSFMMMLVCCILQTVQAIDTSDRDGRTPLMNYVIDKEIEIKNAKFDLKKLWDTYFYKQDIVSNTMHLQGKWNGTYMACDIYEGITLRKIYTTDEDVAQYRKVEDAFNLLIDDTIQNIKRMVRDGADLFAQDQCGKTVMEYCYTKRIYEVLLNLGASDSLCAWCYFNIKEAQLIGLVVIPTTIFSMVIIYGAFRNQHK